MLPSEARVGGGRMKEDQTLVTNKESALESHCMQLIAFHNTSKGVSASKGIKTKILAQSLPRAAGHWKNIQVAMG